MDEIDFNLFSSPPSPDSYTGVGLVAGGGYRLGARWVFDFDIMYLRPGDDTINISVLGAELTINIVSH